MKKMKVLVSFVLVIAMALTMVSAAVAEGALKIGFIGPLTGAAAVYGISAKQGSEIAVEEINALGGMQIEFNAQDDEHDAEKSVNAYNNLMDWGVQLIDGCVTTTPCVAVSAEAFNDRVFMLTPSASSTAVIADKDNVYQVCFTDPAQGAASAQYIGEHALATKVGVIYNNADAYSTGIYQTFMTEAANQPFEVVIETTFTDDTTDFSVQVSAAKDAGAELIFLPIYYTPASMILKQAESMEYNCTFFGVDGMDGILTMEGFDPALAEGVMLLTPFSADATDDKTVSFVTKYQEKYGEVPTQFAADSYDAVYALYQAMQTSGMTEANTTEEICEAMVATFPTMTYEGITGTMQWAADGTVSKTPKAVKIVDGVYVGQ
ncbi:MAG: ABC transporter substrate-binding protein [Eubacteriales bacterium]|nr:ABC transporter substrate-binding protein [Eubacteriales bacterium]